MDEIRLPNKSQEFFVTGQGNLGKVGDEFVVASTGKKGVVVRFNCVDGDPHDVLVELAFKGENGCKAIQSAASLDLPKPETVIYLTPR